MKINKTILSICDYSGTWSKPYRDNGYNVIQVDLKHGMDIRLYEYPNHDVYGILCAPPCTHMAGSGAQYWNKKGDSAILESLSVVDACLRLVAIKKPVFWCLENPVGRLYRWLGKPRMYFNPCDYGDPYTKKTCLWGEFNTNLALNSVKPTENPIMRLGGTSEKTKELRSVTPAGFAKAFYDANR